MSRWEDLAGRAAGRMGLTVARSSSLQNRLPIEATDTDRAIIANVRAFTMTSSERLWSLMQAVRYLVSNQVAGDFVECGVWRGGSIMAMTQTLQDMHRADRSIWLYDTFEGMTAPTEFDVEATSGRAATELLNETQVGDGNNIWCVASEEDVRRNVFSTGYPQDRFTFVRGDVSITLHESGPDRIALLRLDTDWYESTRTSLEVLYPRLAIGGVCIFDDYGHWQGARTAADEYFESQGIHPLMLPIDFSGRVFVKTH